MSFAAAATINKYFRHSIILPLSISHCLTLHLLSAHIKRSRWKENFWNYRLPVIHLFSKKLYDFFSLYNEVSKFLSALKTVLWFSIWYYSFYFTIVIEFIFIISIKKTVFFRDFVAHSVIFINCRMVLSIFIDCFLRN